MGYLSVMLPSLLRIVILLSILGGVLLIAALLGLVWSAVRKKDFLPRFALCAWLCAGLLAWLAFHPVILDHSGVETPLPQEDRETILEVSTGLYSGLMPPVAVELTRRDGGDMTWKVYYFPFGHTELEWLEGEGYNYTRYLFPW